MNPYYLLNKLPENIVVALNDDDVTEILCNPDGCVWHVHRKLGSYQDGTIEHEQALSFIQSVAQYYNQFINAKKPFLDCCLPFSGERLNATIPPISDAACFNIRKKIKNIVTLDDYVKSRALTKKLSDFLSDAIKSRKNILVSGGPGTGKTTFTNALLNEMAVVAPQGCRLLMLEQVPELECRAQNVKRMLTSGSVDLRTLLWIAMRNSPDRIVIGEVRDGAALDMLKAWNTGCPGGIATIHANSPKGALQRVIDLSLEVTSSAPVSLVSEAIDVIVQLEFDTASSAGRRVSSIAEVTGFDRVTQSFTLKEVDDVFEI